KIETKPLRALILALAEGAEMLDEFLEMFGNNYTFVMNGAYALQVCLLQIPAMVAFSGWYNHGIGDEEQKGHTFTLIFPRWDVFAVVFSVFLLTYTYIEGKANYFKGSILILSYLVLMAGFFCAPKHDNY
ncbi:4979_t:CDS:2, partial [Entrophospora sp. SA101]